MYKKNRRAGHRKADLDPKLCILLPTDFLQMRRSVLSECTLITRPHHNSILLSFVVLSSFLIKHSPSHPDGRKRGAKPKGQGCFQHSSSSPARVCRAVGGGANEKVLHRLFISVKTILLFTATQTLIKMFSAHLFVQLSRVQRQKPTSLNLICPQQAKSGHFILCSKLL